MSVAQNLRYYRAQFDPEGAYQSQQGVDGMISMYNPQIMNQLVGAAEKWQQRYDVGKAAEAQEIARIGELETYDLSELNNRLKAFESNINSLVKDKYNGDYGAAANEIARAIGTERTNPFYHFNKQKVEMSKAYLDAKMKLGANFLTNKNPMEVSFQDWQQGQTFDFTPVNRNDIVENSAAVFGTLAKTIIEDPKISSTAGGKLLQIAMQQGLRDPQAVEEYLRTEPGKAMLKQVYDSMPELAGIKDQDRVLDALTQGAYKAIGQTDINFVNDPSYVDPYEAARMNKLGGMGGGPVLVKMAESESVPELDQILTNSVWSDKVDPIVQEEMSKAGYKFKNYQELVDYKKKLSMSFTGGKEEQKAIGVIRNIKDRIGSSIKNNKQMFASDSYQLRPDSFETLADYNWAKGKVNNVINGLPKGSLVGVDASNDKKIKDITSGTFDMKAVQFYPTGLKQSPMGIVLDVTGEKGTGAKKEVVTAKVKINPTAAFAQQELVTSLMMLGQNEEIYKKYLSAIKKTMTPQEFKQYLSDNNIATE